MLGLEADNHVQDVINLACKKALKRKRPSSGKWQSLEDRLLDCYIESCEGAPKDKRFCHGVNLLEKVVHQDNLSTLVVNLYPNHEGYSLMLKGKNGTESETVKLPYEESEFLDYLDAQELPPILIDLLEKSQVNVFYSGCVIVEVRDYRQTLSESNYESSYVLLKPTFQTLVCDVNALADSHWTQEDKLALEAHLLLATEGPLCLDPSPDVGLVTNQLQFNQKKFNCHALKSSLRNYGQAFLKRASVASTNPSPSNLKLIDFLGHYKKPQPPVNLRLAKTPQITDTWRQKPMHLAVPSRLDVDLYAKMIERPKLSSDNSPDTVQEITLEGEKTNNRNYYCKVTIQRRPTDLQYLGELYLEEDTSGNGASMQGGSGNRGKGTGKACQFFLGSKLSAQKYLQQFKDLYTEEGRKSVKICNFIPGQHTNQSTSHHNVIANQGPPQATQNALQIETSTSESSEHDTSGTTTNPTLPITTSINLPSQASVLPSSNLSSLQTYGQKLAAFQQQQQQQSHSSVVSLSQTVTGSSVAVGTKSTQSGGKKGSIAKSSINNPISTKTQHTTLPRRHSQQTDINSQQSPTTVTGGYTGVMGTYIQPVGSGGVNVTLPSGVTVAVASGTPIVSVNNSVASITPGNIQGQFIATGIKSTGQPIQPAPPTPMTLLQGTTTLQPQQGQLTQARQVTTTFTLPGNLVPISQIAPVGGVASMNAQLQAKTSSQTTATGQPTPILPNKPMSPPSGLANVAINARPILPQHPQGQQQRKISVGRTLVNRSTQNIQPLVPIGSQLPPGSQISQQQFQVRFPVQFSQQATQLQQAGQTQKKGSQQTIVQSQLAGQTIQVQSQPVATQAQLIQQVKQGSTNVQGTQSVGKTPSKSPAQRRRSQNK
ncbi:transcription factor SPT20 homolog isoform X2 [Actinia tenebrosa]|uniref:Transcription factor SPT20 homolog isoform X2 n=1 Tax=Actinia tenebrosa TaxID=6105 RepID=A0A6P8HE63_ACTTE|nr:transcription factor SPT20 homolog isoform X2 [Actinia tenebrosa]